MTRTRAFVALGAAAGLVLVGCGESPNTQSGGDAEPDSLVFAVVPTDDGEELERSFEPIVAAIEDATGIETTIEAASSNAGVVEAQAAERVDIAVYGAFSYYLAEEVADVTPVAMDQLTPEPGSGAVSSLGVVAPGSDIESLADVAGRDVCVTDPASTTGYLAAAAGLIEEGIDPEDDISPTFVGSHDVAVTQMLAGDCDVAFASDTFITTLLPARGVIEEGDVETIWTSPDIPGTPLVIGDWLSDELHQQITDAVLDVDAVEAYEQGYCEDEAQQREAPDTWEGDYEGETACLWGGTGAFGFEEATDADYDVIREICETTEAEVCRNE